MVLLFTFYDDHDASYFQTKVCENINTFKFIERHDFLSWSEYSLLICAIMLALLVEPCLRFYSILFIPCLKRVAHLAAKPFYHVALYT